MQPTHLPDRDGSQPPTHASVQFWVYVVKSVPEALTPTGFDNVHSLTAPWFEYIKKALIKSI